MLRRIFGRTPSHNSPKSLFLHVGMGKTATSALQGFFAANEKALKARGILYPKAGRDDNDVHHALATSIFCGSGRTGYEDGRSFTQHLGGLHREVAAASQQKILVSSEILSNCINPEYTGKLLTSFAKRSVIIYFRRQDQYIMSAYSQWVNTCGLFIPIESTVSAVPDYYAIIKRWQGYDPQAGMIVRPYDRARFYKGSIFADFLHHVFACEMAEFEDNCAGKAEVNVRIPHAAMEYMRYVNFLFPESQRAPFRCQLREYGLENRGQSRSLLSGAQRQAILARFSEVNRKIAQDFLPAPDTDFFEAVNDINCSEESVPHMFTENDADAINEFIRAHPQFGKVREEQLGRVREAVANYRGDLSVDKCKLQAEDILVNTKILATRGCV